jgi:uncharacterized membrane protein
MSLVMKEDKSDFNEAGHYMHDDLASMLTKIKFVIFLYFFILLIAALLKLHRGIHRWREYRQFTEEWLL